MAREDNLIRLRQLVYTNRHFAANSDELNLILPKFARPLSFLFLAKLFGIS